MLYNLDKNFEILCNVYVDIDDNLCFLFI